LMLSRSVFSASSSAWIHTAARLGLRLI
jgi:hypothetical protein